MLTYIKIDSPLNKKCFCSSLREFSSTCFPIDRLQPNAEKAQEVVGMAGYGWLRSQEKHRIWFAIFSRIYMFKIAFISVMGAIFPVAFNH